MDSGWFYIDEAGEKQGPCSIEYLKNRKIGQNTAVWIAGMEDWVTADKIQELREILISVPPPTPKEREKIQDPNSKITTDSVSLKRDDFSVAGNQSITLGIFSFFMVLFSFTGPAAMTWQLYLFDFSYMCVDIAVYVQLREYLRLLYEYTKVDSEIILLIILSVIGTISSWFTASSDNVFISIASIGIVVAVAVVNVIFGLKLRKIKYEHAKPIKLFGTFNAICVPIAIIAILFGSVYPLNLLKWMSAILSALPYLILAFAFYIGDSRK